MIRELSDQEYADLLPQYGVSHFMGGCRGADESATIYLTSDNKAILVSYDETEKIKELLSTQQSEAREYMMDLI